MSTTTLPPRTDSTHPDLLGPKLAERLGDKRYGSWFAQSRFAWNGAELTVYVPFQFHKDRISKCYMEPLREVAGELLGDIPQIRIALDPHKTIVSTAVVPVNELEKLRLDVPQRPEPAPAGGSARTARSNRRWHVLNDYVVGPCNRLAYQSVVDLIQDVEHAPRLITLFGPPGVGKTHLLEGLYMDLLGMHPENKPLYLSAEDFTNRYLGALHGNQMTGFRKQFRDAPALLVDNIHFLAGKKSSQEEFLHTLDTLARFGRPVVVTSDRHPKALSESMPQLADRLVGGGCWPLDLPDKLTRINMLQAKSERMNLHLPKDAMTFLAERMRGNVRELEGVLHTVRHFAQVHQEPVTLTLVREAILGQFPEQSKVTTLPLIEQIVCRHLGIEPDRLHENSRARAVSYPRMIVMFLGRRLAGASYSEIGRYYGAKSHTTAIAAERKVAQMLEDDAPLFAKIDRCPVREIIESVEREVYRSLA